MLSVLNIMEISKVDQTLNEYILGETIYLKGKFAHEIYEKYSDKFPCGHINPDEFNFLMIFEWINWAKQN